MRTEYRNEIWDVAELIQRKFCREMPVDPVEIARKLGGVCEGVSHGREDIRFLDACVVLRDNQTFVIRYSNQIPTTHARFCIARELGRLFLSLMQSGNCQDYDMRLNCNPLNSDEEIAVNEFAASLLMPREKFLEYCEKCNFSVKIADMANYFAVSQQAVKLRGKILGLW